MLARALNRWRCGLKQVRLSVKVGHAYCAVDRGERHDVVWFRCGGENPKVVGAARKDINMDSFASDKDVLNQRRYGPVVFEFASTIVRFGGGRQHFDDDGGVQQNAVLVRATFEL